MAFYEIKMLIIKIQPLSFCSCYQFFSELFDSLPNHSLGSVAKNFLIADVTSFKLCGITGTEGSESLIK